MKKTATKKPVKKTAAVLTPIVITGKTAGTIGYRSTFGHVLELPTSKLKTLLRERAIPIPKMKSEMARRLASWCCREGGTFTLTLR